MRKPDPKLLDFLLPYPEDVARTALALRKLVLQEAPNAKEIICRGYAVSIGLSSIPGRAMSMLSSSSISAAATGLEK